MVLFSLIFAITEGLLNLATSLSIPKGKLDEFFKLKTLGALIISILAIIFYKQMMRTINIDSTVLTMIFSVSMYTLIYKYIYKKFVHEALFLSLANMVVLSLSECIAIPLSIMFNIPLLSYIISISVHVLVIILFIRSKFNLSGTMMFIVEYRELDKSHKIIVNRVLIMLISAATIGACLIALSLLTQSYDEYKYINMAMFANVASVYVLYITVTRTFSLETMKIIAANYEELFEMEVAKNEREKSS